MNALNIPEAPLEALWHYRSNVNCPEDFEAFWAEKLAQSRKQPLNISSRPEPYSLPGIRVTELSYDGFQSSELRCRLVRTTGLENHSRIAVVFPGYDFNVLTPLDALRYVIQGIPTLLVDVRGQGLRSADANAYDFSGTPGLVTKGLEGPDNYYYTQVYLDGVRAIDAVVQHLGFGNPKVVVEGFSQGGAIALAMGYLSEHSTVVLSDAPFLCNIPRSVQLADAGPYGEVSRYFMIQDPLHETEESLYKTLSYVDGVNMARFIGRPVLLRTGLKDDTCPPSSAFAVYNQLQGHKDLQVYPEWGHQEFSFRHEGKHGFLASCASL